MGAITWKQARMNLNKNQIAHSVEEEQWPKQKFVGIHSLKTLIGTQEHIAYDDS